ncbi:MAG: replicative DNA helicase [Bacillota bacterium]|nr:replicative DNA helicase [Bacillota bacterium]
MQELQSLPNDIRAEIDLLGGIIYNPKIITTVVEHLKADDFYKTSHQLIFNAMCQLFAEGKDINVTLLVSTIGKDNLQNVGGVSYLTTLMTSGLPLNPKTYINILKDKAYRRKAIKAMIQGIEKMSNEKENANATAGELINILTVGADTKTSILSEEDLFKKTLEEIEKHYQNGGEITGMQTGLLDFDRATNGLKRGELFVYAGRPSMGKTLAALHIADGLAKNGYKVLEFELEMTEESLGIRRLAYTGGIESIKLQTGKLTDEEFLRIAQSSNELIMQDNIFTDCSSYQSILTIKAKAKATKQTKGLDCIIIDHLTLMDIADHGNRSNDIGEITRQLKMLAKELDINVILLSQLSRAVEMRADKRPMMSDLRESGNIEQDADLIVFAYRDEYYNPETEDKNIMEWIISKQRNGAVGTIKLFYIDKLQKIGNLDYVKR